MRKLLVGMLFAVLVGCNRPEETITLISQKVIVPAVEKAIAQTHADAYQLSGDIQGINPGYDVEVEGLWVVGFKGRAKVVLAGVAGHLSGATQGHAATSQPVSP